MAKRYEYKFVKVGATFWLNTPKEDLQKTIDEHAKDGWRFVQIFHPGLIPMVF